MHAIIFPHGFTLIKLTDRPNAKNQFWQANSSGAIFGRGDPQELLIVAYMVAKILKLTLSFTIFTRESSYCFRAS